MTITHSLTCRRVFARYDLSCQRCQELASGAPARLWRGAKRRQVEAAKCAAIKAHDCKRSHCGTFGDD